MKRAIKKYVHYIIERPFQPVVSVIVHILLAIVITFFFLNFLYFPILATVIWVPVSFTLTIFSGGDYKRKGLLRESIIAFVIYMAMLFISFPQTGFSVRPFFLSVSKHLNFPAVLFFTSGMHLLINSIIHLRKARKKVLVTTGPYAIVRHPQHLAILMIVFGAFLPAFFPASFLTGLAFYFWFRKAGRVEEEIFLHNPATATIYKAYQASVPPLFPSVRRFIFQKSER